MFLNRWLHTLRLGLKSLALHKLRSMLTILGVVLGVSSVIVMLAIGEGARSEALRQIQELGATNIILRSVKPTGSIDESESMAVRFGLTAADLDRIADTIPSVLSAVPMRERQAEVRCRERSLECRVVGVTPGYDQLNGLRLRQGRFISELDLKQVATVAVLAPHTAESLFPFEDPVGRSIRIGEDRYFQVVGVTEPRAPVAGIGDSLPAQDYQRDVYVPFSSESDRLGEMFTFMSGGNLRGEIVEITQITIAVDEMKHVKQTAEVVQGLVSEFHKQPDVSITVPLDLLERAERTQRVFTMVLGAIAAIALVVGGIGIMNIMLATVTERTREIGIRRALGAKRRDITLQFLLETVALSSSGGVFGVCLGVALSTFVTRMIEVPTLVRLWSLALAFTISVAIGLLFGTYPARRAAFMDPIEALRHE
jgi:putative ABC transport system permease protein